MTTPTIKTEEELREEFKKRFAGIHDVTSWGYQACGYELGGGECKCSDAVADYWLSQMASYKEALLERAKKLPRYQRGGTANATDVWINDVLSLINNSTTR